MNNAAQKAKGIEAYLLLNELGGNLATSRGADVVFDAMSRPGNPLGITMSAEVERGIVRMIWAHIIISLARWSEVYKRYSNSVGDVMPAECKAIYLDLKQRKVRDFRNEWAAHILGKNTSRPLTREEIQKYIEKITQGDTKAFLKWVNTVEVATETWCGQIRTKYGLTEADLFRRARTRRMTRQSTTSRLNSDSMAK